MPTSAASVTTTATQIVAKRTTQPGRIGLILTNMSSVPVYLGDDDTVTTSTGTPLPATSTREFFPHNEVVQMYYRGDVYGIVDEDDLTGTDLTAADVRVWEITTV